jgi:hypothetical protein
LLRLLLARLLVFSALATCLAAYTTVPDGANACADADFGAARTASVLVALLTVLNTLALGISSFLKFEQRAEAHHMTAARFAVLENRVVGASFLELPDTEWAPLFKQWGDEAVEAAEACAFPLLFWASSETSLASRAPPLTIDFLDACCPPRWLSGARLPRWASARVRPEREAEPVGKLAASSAGAAAAAAAQAQEEAQAQAPGAPGRPLTPAAPAAPAPTSPARAGRSLGATQSVTLSPSPATRTRGKTPVLLHSLDMTLSVGDRSRSPSGRPVPEYGCCFPTLSSWLSLTTAVIGLSLLMLLSSSVSLCCSTACLPCRRCCC